MPITLIILLSHTNNRRLGAIFLFICLLCLSNAALANPLALPFHKGERLCYQISWGFIPAGHSTLEVAADSDNGAAYHFIMTARTLPAIDLFYKYRERVDSYVTADVRESLLYKRVQESRHPRDIVVRFDWQKETALYTNHGMASEPIPLQPGTLDPLSALYYIRGQVLGDHAAIDRWVTDGKKMSRGKAGFIKRETITIRGKEYRTIKIEPDLRAVDGVFEKSPKAKMYIWLTDDDRKILVKLQSEVRVGSFVAELLEEESVIPTPGKSAPRIKPADQPKTDPAVSTQPPFTRG